MPTSLAQRLARIADHSTLRLVHTGRKSGKEYEVTIWFAVDGETVFLGTMNRDRQWVRNVKKNPGVKLRVGGEEFSGSVEALGDEEEMRHVYVLFTRKYWAAWLLDCVASLLGRSPRTGKVDVGRSGYFRVQLKG